MISLSFPGPGSGTSNFIGVHFGYDAMRMPTRYDHVAQHVVTKFLAAFELCKIDSNSEQASN